MVWGGLIPVEAIREFQYEGQRRLKHTYVYFCCRKYLPFLGTVEWWMEKLSKEMNGFILGKILYISHEGLYSSSIQ